MSYDTSAILLYGFEVKGVSRKRALAATNDRYVTVSGYGDCHGHEGVYICASDSVTSVDLGGFIAVHPEIKVNWWHDLSKFCDANEIEFTIDMPGWRLTSSRS